MKNWILFTLMIISVNTVAYSAEKIWDSTQLKFSSGKGKKATLISVTKNTDNTYDIFISKKSRTMLDIKRIQAGKGEIAGTLVLQFDIPDNNKYKKLIIYQNGKEISCKLEYIKQLKAKLVQ